MAALAGHAVSPKKAYRGMSTAQRQPSRQRRADDERLVQLITAIAESRSKEAFAELFRNFAPRLKAYGMRAGADAQTAEEVAQEAMIAVWRKAASFDPKKASVSTWIFTIVRNKRIDMLRREARPDLKEEDFLHLEKDPVGADDVVESAETHTIIKSCMKTLPAEQAQVIQMAYFEDKSHRAISDELALPLGTVKSRIRLALARIKDSMAEQAS